MLMKLWLLSQDEYGGYDTYDSIVVAAETRKIAKNIHPCGKDGWTRDPNLSGWASKPENVTAKLIGTAGKGIKEGIILASFFAG